MPSKTPAILAMAAGASLVRAHGYVSSWTIGGTTYQGFDEQWAVSQSTDTGNEFIAWSTSASDNGYVAPDAYTTSDIICHKDASNGALNNATVAAGDSITATWNTWPDSHHGPVITYVAQADDPTSVDKTSLNWIKIAERGLVSGSNPGTWATDELIDNSFAWDITIPSDLKAGNYVLRHEIIALHSASNEDGAQNYPQCVNLQVTGSGSSLPDGTAGTSLYTEDEDGIVFNLYTDFDSYPIPGPDLAFSDSGSSSGSSSSSSSSSGSSGSSSSSSSSSGSSGSSGSGSSGSSATANAAAAAATTPASSGSSCNKRRHARQLKH